MNLGDCLLVKILPKTLFVRVGGDIIVFFEYAIARRYVPPSESSEQVRLLAIKCIGSRYVGRLMGESLLAKNGVFHSKLFDRACLRVGETNTGLGAGGACLVVVGDLP